MIFGIGTDIVSHARIQTVHERYGDRFAHRILSPQELPEYFKHTQPSRLLLKRFAAKEALSKAVGHGLRSPAYTLSISSNNGSSNKLITSLVNSYKSGLSVFKWMVPPGFKICWYKRKNLGWVRRFLALEPRSCGSGKVIHISSISEGLK